MILQGGRILLHCFMGDNVKNSTMALLAVLLFAAQAFAGNVIQLTTHIDERGKRTEFITTKDVLAKCPQWKTDTEPPFPIHKAIDVAKQWIKKKYPKFTDIRVVSVSLAPIWEPDFQDRWYYGIGTSASVDMDGVSASSYFSVMVLMDGTVIGPTSPRDSE